MLKKHCCVFCGQQIHDRIDFFFFFNAQLLLVSEYSQDCCPEWFEGYRSYESMFFHRVSSFGSTPQVPGKNGQGHHPG